jgi:hypothetical protein
MNTTPTLTLDPTTDAQTRIAECEAEVGRLHTQLQELGNADCDLEARQHALYTAAAGGADVVGDLDAITAKLQDNAGIRRALQERLHAVSAAATEAQRDVRKTEAAEIAQAYTVQRDRLNEVLRTTELEWVKFVQIAQQAAGCGAIPSVLILEDAKNDMKSSLRLFSDPNHPFHLRLPVIGQPRRY